MVVFVGFGVVVRPSLFVVVFFVAVVVVGWERTSLVFENCPPFPVIGACRIGCSELYSMLDLSYRRMGVDVLYDLWSELVVVNLAFLEFVESYASSVEMFDGEIDRVVLSVVLCSENPLKYHHEFDYKYFVFVDYAFYSTNLYEQNHI